MSKPSFKRCALMRAFRWSYYFFDTIDFRGVNIQNTESHFFSVFEKKCFFAPQTHMSLFWGHGHLLSPGRLFLYVLFVVAWKNIYVEIKESIIEINSAKMLVNNSIFAHWWENVIYPVKRSLRAKWPTKKHVKKKSAWWDDGERGVSE